ncbi:carph-isopro domain-containing protein [Fodinicurvata sp. EGI_FJ10296]|uniref:carph-isopro domain-containing protein n=1 Tax=Fodinicurvata sp. EGI_FJ10296 TaxID=3231908 RepID=UPI00345279D4
MIINLWPSAADLARDIGVPYQTVAAWRRRNSIPPRHWQSIISAGSRRGVSLTVECLAGAALRRDGKALSDTAREKEGRAR